MLYILGKKRKFRAICRVKEEQIKNIWQLLTSLGNHSVPKIAFYFLRRGVYSKT